MGNVGYSKGNEKADKMNCPICGSHIYISKHYNDFVCVKKDCLLSHGAKHIISMCPTTIKVLENMLEELEKENTNEG